MCSSVSPPNTRFQSFTRLFLKQTKKKIQKRNIISIMARRITLQALDAIVVYEKFSSTIKLQMKISRDARRMKRRVP